MRKKIALIVDLEDWAFSIEANLLKEKLKKYYDIDIYALSNYNNDLFDILEEVKKYDIIHFFWRKVLLDFESESFKQKIIDNNYDYFEYIKICNKISTGIYDHLFIDETDKYKNIFTKYCKKYYTCSKKLEEIYNSIDYPKPYGTIHDTFDSNLFKNKKKKKDKLVIGWVGNSKWNIKYKDFKGFYSILEPVVDSLIEEGYNIEKNYADKNIIFRTNREMPDYYNSIDICVIASISEGTPRPLLEAMSCGCAIISTDVGIVKEVVGPIQSEYIIGERVNDNIIKQRLKEKIIYLYKNRDILNKIKEENIIYSKKCDIDHTYLEYKKYFDSF